MKANKAAINRFMKTITLIKDAEGFRIKSHNGLIDYPITFDAEPLDITFNLAPVEFDGNESVTDIYQLLMDEASAIIKIAKFILILGDDDIEYNSDYYWNDGDLNFRIEIYHQHYLYKCLLKLSQRI